MSLPDENSSHVLHALVRKRAELAGRIEHNQLELRRLIGELDHIDATIRIFDPAIDIGQIRSKPVPPRHAAFKGEVTRLVLNMLRESSSPVTSRQIAERLMLERGLDPEDRELSVVMVKRVCACLRKHRLAGTITTAPVDGRFQGWIVAGREVQPNLT